MTIQTQTSRQYFNNISLLYFVLLIGQIVILSVLFYIRNYAGYTGDMSDYEDIFILTAVGVSIASILGTIFLSRTKLHEICENIHLQEKLSLYRTLAVTKLILLEGSTIISAVLYFISGSLELLGLSIIMIIIFAIHKPNKEKIITSINLTGEDILKLENPAEIVAEIKMK